MAGQGFHAEAVDISDVALRYLSGRHPGVFPACVDLDDFRIPRNRYDLIVNIDFLDRRLVPGIREGLVKGGMLTFETLTTGSERIDGAPCNRDHLLAENEHLYLFLPLKIRYYEEVERAGEKCRNLMASRVAFKTWPNTHSCKPLTPPVQKSKLNIVLRTNRIRRRKKMPDDVWMPVEDRAISGDQAGHDGGVLDS